MKLFVVNKMPDPREAGYRDALIHWIEHFVKQTHGKAFVLFTNFKLMQEVAELMQPFFDELGRRLFRAGHGHAALDDAGEVQGRRGLGALRHRQFLAGRGCAGRGVDATSSSRGCRSPCRTIR